MAKMPLQADWSINRDPIDVLPQTDVDDETLDDVRDAYAELLHDGVDCPCCGRFSKIYARRLNLSMARSLCWLVGRYASISGWIDVPNTAPKWLVRTNQLPTLAWWKLVKRAPSADVKKKHSGLWMPTRLGTQFAHGEVKIPDTVVTLFGNVLYYSADFIWIDDVTDGFDYREMLEPA